MVYRETDEHRHPLPLRLGAAGTDAVVETHKIRCTHFDAYRFFTPDAVELNTLRPTRGSMTAMEQPGCLHAGMDVYKWATKLGPAVPGDLLLDCFELARDIRTLDMQASPYDVTTYGLDPVTIETPEGKAEYVARQRGFAERGNALRDAAGRGVRGAVRLTERHPRSRRRPARRSGPIRACGPRTCTSRSERRVRPYDATRC